MPFNWTWSGGEFRLEVQDPATGHTMLSGHGSPVDVRNSVTSPVATSVLRSELPFYVPALAISIVLNSPKYSISMAQPAQLNGNPATHIYVVDETDAIGLQVTPQDWYLDPTSNLPLRVEYHFQFDPTPSHCIEMSYDFGTYKSANGILTPYQLTLTVNGILFSAAITSLNLNAPIAPSTFDPTTGSTQ